MLRSGDLTSVELVSACLKNIEARNKPARNASGIADAGGG